MHRKGYVVETWPLLPINHEKTENNDIFKINHHEKGTS